jgi:hypothetical protein
MSDALTVDADGDPGLPFRTIVEKRFANRRIPGSAPDA